MLAGGEVVERVGKVRWRCAGRCEAPLLMVLRGRPSERLGSRQRVDSRTADTQICIDQDHDAVMTSQDGPPNTVVEVEAPCRKCEACAKAKQAHWARRAVSEARASHRTWYGTITLSPERHVEMLSRTRLRLGRGGTDLESLTEVEAWREREREIARELMLMWKRLRKAGCQFRFMLVVESVANHQNGLPHYHCLLHEVGDPIRHKTLKRAWPHGFTKWTLVEEPVARTCWYVCKYLTKDTAARVRASVSYGHEREPTASSDTEAADFSLEKSAVVFTSGEIAPSPTEEGRDPPAPGLASLGEQPEGRVGLIEDGANAVSGRGLSNPEGEKFPASGERRAFNAVRLPRPPTTSPFRWASGRRWEKRSVGPPRNLHPVDTDEGTDEVPF